MHASPSLPVSTHMYTRATIYPLLPDSLATFFYCFHLCRLDSVSSIRFLVFVTVQGDPIAREFARRE